MKNNNIENLFNDQDSWIYNTWFDFKFWIWDKPRDKWRSIKRFFYNAWAYREFLSSSYEWDYGFLLGVLKAKLQNMHDYFSTSNITVEAPKITEELRLAIKLLDIATDDEPVPDDAPLFYVPSKVNERNAKRFIKRYNSLKETSLKMPGIDGELMMLHELRQEKAWNIFFRYCSQKMRGWWD